MERRLSEAETKYLIALAQQGDEDAMEDLIVCNTRLVRKIVIDMNKLPHEREDFLQIGMIGLVKAIRKFDLERNLKFSTYAVPTIKGEIGRFTRDKAGLLKVSRDLNITTNKIHYHKLHDLSPEEVSEKLGLNNVELAKDALELASISIDSLDSSLSQGEDKDVTLMDFVHSDINSEWFEMIAFRDAMSRLDDRERLVIRLRFDYELPQLEVGKIIGVSQMQVSRIEKRTITKLKESFLEKELV